MRMPDKPVAVAPKQLALAVLYQRVPRAAQELELELEQELVLESVSIGAQHECRLGRVSFPAVFGLANVSILPSGKSPEFPFPRCLPRNHPSPNSSSRSRSSTLSPLPRLSSSELRAWNPSATQSALRCLNRRGWALTNNNEDVADLGTRQRLARCHDAVAQRMSIR